MDWIRGMRFWVMWVVAIAVLVWFGATDPDGGRETLQRVQWLAWLLVVTGLVYLVRRALHPEFRGGDLWAQVKRGNVAAGVAAAGLMILTGFLFLAFAGRATAAELQLPPKAVQGLPVLDAEITAHWPSMPLRSVLGALVDKETCYSRTHPKCWSPRAELKTKREYGFGWGQLTVAYRGDGSERFNAFRDVKRLDRALAGWTWENRYEPKMQARALVVMNRTCFNRMRELVADEFNALALCDAAYNGGMGGMLAERRMCAARPGCDPDKWFGHVELHSTKSRKAWDGYGESAFDINRGHVKAVMVTRRPPYILWWAEI
jgi:hypothetical protein